jgi:hypothetical protein
VSETKAPLRANILDRCARVQAALTSLPETDLTEFSQTLRWIQSDVDHASDENLALVDLRLDRLVRILRLTDAGDGENILGFSRWEKFFGEPPIS